MMVPSIKKYGLKSTLVITGFTVIIVSLLIGLGSKFDWNLLIIIAGVLFIRILLTFNIVGIDQNNIYFYYPINPLKKLQHFTMFEIKNVQLVNNSVYGGSAKVTVITKNGLEHSIQLICFKRELITLCNDLQAKGVEADIFFY